MTQVPVPAPVSRWLAFVLKSDRAALILRAGGEISEDYWRSMLDYRSTV